MQLLLATEIYGRNGHVAALARELERCGARVELLDPYDGRELGLRDEDEAWACFLATGGPERYARLAARRAAALTGPFLAVGFSAGAAAVWALACGSGPHPLRACCFYGSGIRHAAGCAPHCPVDVILPRRESRFDVAALGRELAAHPTVRLHATPWEHGFMNPLSPGHSSEGRACWTARLGDLVREFSLPAS